MLFVFKERRCSYQMEKRHLGKTTTQKEEDIALFLAVEGLKNINLHSWVKLHRSCYFWNLIKLLEARLWKSGKLNLTCSLE